MKTDTELGIWTGMECDICSDELVKEPNYIELIFHAVFHEEILDDGSIKMFVSCPRMNKIYSEIIRKPRLDGYHYHQGYETYHPINRKHRVRK